jgi:hypothetical protein
MSNKKDNLFIVKDLKSIKASKDIPGARITYYNRISENRCKVGETIAFVDDWSRGKFEKGEILGKFSTPEDGENKWAIIYKPHTWGEFAGLHNVVKGKIGDKVYLNSGSFNNIVDACDDGDKLFIDESYTAKYGKTLDLVQVTSRVMRPVSDYFADIGTDVIIFNPPYSTVKEDL